MTDKPNRKRWRWRRALWIVVASLVTYVLSIGPAFRVTGVPILVSKAYGPVFRAARMPVLRPALASYLNAWAPAKMEVTSGPDSGIMILQQDAQP
jgi:hypothetical protein